MKIAITGKGGVGKTSIAGTLACIFARKGLKTIAIDVDSSPNLALTLGLTESQSEAIIPVTENVSIIEKKTRTEYPGVYKLSFTVDDIIASEAVTTPCGVRLLVMGTVKTMGSGCACPAHSVVRMLISHLITQSDEIVILDMEAGIEHLGRGTAEYVDTLFIVTDAHQPSLITAERIFHLAHGGGISRIAIIGNRVTGPDMEEKIRSFASTKGIPIAGIIPFDQEIIMAGINGTTLLYLKSPGIQAIAEINTWLFGEMS